MWSMPLEMFRITTEGENLHRTWSYSCIYYTVYYIIIKHMQLLAGITVNLRCFLKVQRDC